MANQQVTGSTSLSIGPTISSVSSQYVAGKTPATWSVAVLDSGGLTSGSFLVTISASGLLTISLAPGVSVPPGGVNLVVSVSASSGPGNGNNDSLTVFTNVAERIVPCFVEGTLIETLNGMVPIEDLSPGDWVITMSGVTVPIRWIGQRHVSKQEFIASPKVRPVCICKDALGPGCPNVDLYVSPLHRILVQGWAVQLAFGEPSAFSHAIHLLNERTIQQCARPRSFNYYHILFDGHEVINSSGAMTESLYLGEGMLSTFARPDVEELMYLFPDLEDRVEGTVLARPCLKRHESMILARSIGDLQ